MDCVCNSKKWLTYHPCCYNLFINLPKSPFIFNLLLIYLFLTILQKPAIIRFWAQAKAWHWAVDRVGSLVLLRRDRWLSWTWKKGTPRRNWEMQGDEARILLGFSPCSRPSSSQVRLLHLLSYFNSLYFHDVPSIDNCRLKKLTRGRYGILILTCSLLMKSLWRSPNSNW